MRIRVEDLDPAGLVLGLDASCTWAAHAVAGALDGEVLVLEGTLRVRPVGPGVVVEGSARALVRRDCDRCLSPLKVALGGDLDLYFQGPPAPVEGELSLEPDELDVGFYEDGELDLGAVLAEFFVLEAPSVLRCEGPGVERIEPGACELPGAGVAQEGQDGCDPRLAALRGVVVK